MGSRSKQRTEDRGAFGSKKLITVMAKVRTADHMLKRMPREMQDNLKHMMVNEASCVVSVVRPNRGRVKKMVLFRRRKGFQQTKIDPKKIISQIHAEQKEKKSGFMNQVKRIFQRKAS